MFRIDPAFEATSHALGELALCQARLQADARFPWIVLLPRVAEARELEDLAPADRQTLMSEILAAGAAVRAIGEALGRPVFKLNVGQLGNLTPQLHVHIVGRRPDDPAWPGPVWGHGAAETYPADALRRALDVARRALVLPTRTSGRGKAAKGQPCAARPACGGGRPRVHRGTRRRPAGA